MKFLLLSDINVIKNKYKLILFYLTALVLFCFYLKNNSVINADLITLGIIKENNFLSLLIYILNILFYIQISLSLFINDIKYNFDSLLNRMGKKRYLKLRLYNTFIWVFIFKLLTFFIIFLIYNKNLTPLIFIISLVSSYIYYLGVYFIIFFKNKILLILLLVYLLIYTNINICLLFIILIIEIIIFINLHKFLNLVIERRI